MKKLTSTIALLLALSFALVSLPIIGVVKADSTIYIRADGTIEGTDKIQRDGNAYTFTDDIFDPIVVDRNNIVIDGAGYILQGNGSGMGILGITGISLDYRSNVTIKNIQIKNFYSGIWLRDSSNNIISGNNIIENHFGIFISGSFNIISGNTITNNNSSITLDGSSAYNIISGNTVTNSNDFTIALSGSSNNTISDNTLKNNNGYCIYLSGSSDNTISGNNITNSEYSGIYLHDSFSNMIFHNNLINNQNQIYLWAANVTWDDGYPSGGNYWSDYNGVDEYSGVNQDEPGSDGISDTPYIIDANNKDNYPLMKYFIVPEFPSWPILPLFMIATLAVIFYSKSFRARLRHF